MAAAATDQQVQRFVNERVRTSAEAIRAVVMALDDHIASIDDIYAALTAPAPTWKDDRVDGPPHLLAPSDVLAINSIWHDLRDAIKNNPQYPVLLKACVRAVGN